MNHIQTVCSNGSPPLVTFALFAFNQEKFIREAIKGAFSQTYSHLEIILSDDCSSDRTFEIMQEMAAEYDGLHTVILNRNKNNLGVGGHVNRMMEIANGELIVGAAGDDISLPERTAIICDEWMASGKKHKSLFSNQLIINELGETTGKYFKNIPSYTRNITDFMNNRRCWVTGCSHAFEKSLFDIYGPIDRRIIQEDGAISFRAILSGKGGHRGHPMFPLSS